MTQMARPTPVNVCVHTDIYIYEYIYDIYELYMIYIYDIEICMCINDSVNSI